MRYFAAFILPIDVRLLTNHFNKAVPSSPVTEIMELLPHLLILAVRVIRTVGRRTIPGLAKTAAALSRTSSWPLPQTDVQLVTPTPPLLFLFLLTSMFVMVTQSMTSHCADAAVWSSLLLRAASHGAFTLGLPGGRRGVGSGCGLAEWAWFIISCNWHIFRRCHLETTNGEDWRFLPCKKRKTNPKRLILNKPGQHLRNTNHSVTNVQVCLTFRYGGQSKRWGERRGHLDKTLFVRHFKSNSKKETPTSE